jgi:hypothetical protein
VRPLGRQRASKKKASGQRERKRASERRGRASERRRDRQRGGGSIESEVVVSASSARPASALRPPKAPACDTRRCPRSFEQESGRREAERGVQNPRALLSPRLPTALNRRPATTAAVGKAALLDHHHQACRSLALALSLLSSLPRMLGTRSDPTSGRKRESTRRDGDARESSTILESISPLPYPVRVDDVGDDDELARVGAVVDQRDAPDLDVAGERHGVLLGRREGKKRGERGSLAEKRKKSERRERNRDRLWLFSSLFFFAYLSPLCSLCLPLSSSFAHPPTPLLLRFYISITPPG